MVELTKFVLLFDQLGTTELRHDIFRLAVPSINIKPTLYVFSIFVSLNKFKKMSLKKSSTVKNYFKHNNNGANS